MQQNLLSWAQREDTFHEGKHFCESDAFKCVLINLEGMSATLGILRRIRRFSRVAAVQSVALNGESLRSPGFR